MKQASEAQSGRGKGRTFLEVEQLVEQRPTDVRLVAEYHHGAIDLVT